MDADFRPEPMKHVQPGFLLPLAEKAGAALKQAGQSVSVFEATSAGLIQAALQTCPGASSYITCGAVTYGPKKAMSVLGSVDLSAPKPADADAYKQSKRTWTRNLAKQKREEVGATWCICESGACGPTFTYEGISNGFTAIYVSGPVEKGIFVESDHNKREENMWGFTKMALDLLAECVEEARAAGLTEAPADSAPIMTVSEDRYGGAEMKVCEGAVGAMVGKFDQQLKKAIKGFIENGKKGLWLTVPLSSASCVGAAAACGFHFHHAKPEYVLLTRWLPDTPSPLPRYGFTQIGVGGVVVNSKDEVLMVQEKVSPLANFQGSWKLPGGLADPGEDFANTVQREVHEECGITAKPEGVVSIRHSHGFRFGQGDLYVVVKLRAEKEDIVMDPHELMGAQWMSIEHLRSIVADPKTVESLDGKCSTNNITIVETALFGALMEITALPNSRGPRATLMYHGAKNGKDKAS
eukprot:TRINITY_DN18029_c1_g1_i1.p1 TRINITY_DN18029_c1_g1~~TRINITY_DN18029_c1_g1_i1.p1  ORF type:complete len:500 (+),score=61.87 TRINITY_DN18029_c1_g1_i1:101-1501(+)